MKESIRPAESVVTSVIGCFHGRNHSRLTKGLIQVRGPICVTIQTAEKPLFKADNSKHISGSTLGRNLLFVQKMAASADSPMQTATVRSIRMPDWSGRSPQTRSVNIRLWITRLPLSGWQSTGKRGSSAHPPWEESWLRRLTRSSRTP